MRIAVVILAAGAGSRYGGGKVIAPVRGRPVLAHVLTAAAALQPAATFLVLGTDADAVLAAVDPGSAHVLRNPDPGRGLASSLRIGVEGAAALRPAPDAILLLLGDQPLVRAEVAVALLAAASAEPGGPPVIAPRYADEPDAVLHPALLLPPAWPLVAGLTGDRGLGPLLAARPELLRRVPVAGANPDLDTPADLARIEGAGSAAG